MARIYTVIKQYIEGIMTWTPQTKPRKHSKVFSIIAVMGYLMTALSYAAYRIYVG